MNRTITLLFALASITEALAVDVTINPQPARCGLNNGSVNASATGGLPPYSYSWSNGATTASIYSLAPGNYTVTVTDGLSNTAQATATVDAVFELFPVYGPYINQLQPDCQSLCTGIAQFSEGTLLGTAPYTYLGPVIDMGGFGEKAIMGICAQQVTQIPVTDANGCPGTIDATGVVVAVDPATVTVQNTTPACQGEANGTMTVVLDGPAASLLHVSLQGGGYAQYHAPSWGIPYTVSGLPAGIYDLVSEIPSGFGGTLCYTYYGGAIGEIPAPCGSVSGEVFNDADQDCVFDAVEYGLPYRVLTIEPGPAYAITDAEGAYYSASGFGGFTLAQPLAEESQLCPTVVPAPYTINASTPDVTLDLADSSFAPLDTRISFYPSQARPGFPAWIHGTVVNESSYPSGAITLVLNYDPMLDPITVSPAPASQSPGTVQWDLAALEPFGFQNFQLHGSIPANINLLGTLIQYMGTATDASPESNTANNTVTTNVTITGSYDPNDKTARTSSGSSTTQYFLDEDAFIDYTIRFQNTGTDTAFTVVVRDSLELDLDPSSLEILGASHTFTPSFENGRTLVFTFSDINLPDSGTNFVASNGSVHFRIRPRTDIIIGEVISNSAGIHFDFNPPVITPPSELLVEMSTSLQEQESGRLRVFPNPAGEELRVILDDPVHRVFSADVLSLDGRVMLRANTLISGEVIVTRELPAGAYVVRLRDADGGIRQAPFVKR